MPVSRRLFLAATLPWFASCSTPLPFGPRPPNDASASRRLLACADAHGLDAYRRIHDISVGYDGQWRPFVNGIQPDVVDAAWRGSSQERFIPTERLHAQANEGSAGRKQVVRQGGRTGNDSGRVAVWRNGMPSTDDATLGAAALVADGYTLFLLGPLTLVDRGLVVQAAGTERVDGHDCDVLDVWLTPGLGQSPLDRIALYVDRADDTMRRVRFTLEGTANTQGAVAEVDTYDHQRRFGVLWPMRSHERIVHPIHLPAHDWHVTGLDVDRGYDPVDIAGPAFTGKASAPAASI